MTGLADKNGIDPIYQFNRNKPIRLLIFTESFHPYTSGIARRFKTIIEYLAHTNEYLIHVVTGCQGCETAWQNDSFMQSKVTYSTSLFSIDFKDKIECALPFLIPQVNFKGNSSIHNKSSRFNWHSSVWLKKLAWTHIWYSQIQARCDTLCWAYTGIDIFWRGRQSIGHTTYLVIAHKSWLLFAIVHSTNHG